MSQVQTAGYLNVNFNVDCGGIWWRLHWMVVVCPGDYYQENYSPNVRLIPTLHFMT